MAQRQCLKCGEMVDEAKAFCPACGEAFVEETRREEASVFESMEGTMQLGNTMYNQLLSDMGLNISDKTDKPVQKAIDPEATIPPATVRRPVQTIQPSAPAPAKSSGIPTWLIVAAIVLALFFLVLIIVGIAGYLFYRSQAA